MIRESMDAMPADTRKDIIIVLFMVRGKTGVVNPLIVRYTANNNTAHMPNVAKKM